jgi:DNA-nicking Smr family endonuclease
MKDVVPLAGRNRRVARAPHHLPAAPPPGGRLRSEEASVRRELMELLENGTGFDWSLTDEYLEHSGRCVDPRLARQLHEGRFSVQACIDLHGLSLKEAKTAVDRFLLEAVQTRKNAVLIVHGRGLSSPGEPVLKAGLVKWLRSAPWRRWIAAYATARSCDGGPGATYVLLRPTPGGPKKGRRTPGFPRAGPG